MNENFGEEKIEVTEQDAIRTTRLSVILSTSCLSAGLSGEASRKTEIFKDDEPALTARIRLVMSQSVVYSVAKQLLVCSDLELSSGSGIRIRDSELTRPGAEERAREHITSLVELMRSSTTGGSGDLKGVRMVSTLFSFNDLTIVHEQWLRET